MSACTQCHDSAPIINIFLHLCLKISTISVSVEATELPYITLGVTVGVATDSVPRALDGVSQPISMVFPFGSYNESTVYVCMFIISYMRRCKFAFV